jgi:integrase
VDFIAGQTGTRLGALREPVADRDVQGVRRPVVLMADALAGRAVVIGRPVIPAKDGCPARFRPLRDDYVASCRARGNAEATVAAKDKAASRFLAFLAAAGWAPQGLAGRLPPHRHLRHESEPHLWTAEEIRRLLAVIDRQSAVGKRDYAMILLTARLGLRISDLRQLELGDLDWRAKTLTIVQRKTGRPLSLPLLDDVGWAVIDYVRHGRPETACAKVFVKHSYPFGAFGCSSSVACRLSRYAARTEIEFPPGQACGMHSLRGALAVAMIGNGAPMPVISAVLGHTSTDTTQAYYLRFDVERLRCCALDVEDVLGRAGAGERGA